MKKNLNLYCAVLGVHLFFNILERMYTMCNVHFSVRPCTGLRVNKTYIVRTNCPQTFVFY